MKILDVRPLSFPWETADPFLFCVFHQDTYPAGNDQMGPDTSLAGRPIGNDFEGIDGWRMYHGERVPGFRSIPIADSKPLRSFVAGSSTMRTHSALPPATEMAMCNG